MPSWKLTQSKKKSTKKIRLALAVLVLFLGLIILAQVIKLTSVLFSPWNMPASSARVPWNGESNINLVIRSGSISLLSFNPKEDRVTVINIPDNTYLKVAGGFGDWQLRSVYDLGGYQALKDSLKVFFGLPIDGYVEGDLLGGFSKLADLKTDLTLWELIRLQIGFWGIRFDKMEKVDLGSFLDKQTLADGTQVLTADPVKLDSQLTNMMEPAVTSEHQSIAIFNATDKPGLAQTAARMITNIGGEVIIITNSRSKLKTSRVTGKPSKTLQRLKNIFECLKCDSIDLTMEDLVSSRAQINLFLGEDFIDKL